MGGVGKKLVTKTWMWKIFGGDAHPSSAFAENVTLHILKFDEENSKHAQENSFAVTYLAQLVCRGL